LNVAIEIGNFVVPMEDWFPTFVVTGATGKIGRALVLGLARLPNIEIIAVGRDPERVQDLLHVVERSEPRCRVRGEIVDVASSRSIEAFGQRLEGAVHVLINNAAVAPPTREVTEAGIEKVFATNVLGYSWMTQSLLGALCSRPNARIVNVASAWAGDLELTDLEFVRRPYDNGVAYRQSKQANRMLTVHWARRLSPHGISVNSCHPGEVDSKLSNDLGFGGSRTPEQGARTPLWLATSKDVEGLTGKYFEQQHLTPCRFAADTDRIDELARRCEAYA
jgi:NAD(P)-dependent dehydrogenase (short-subunit alcohol dehydrogenase family)